MQIEAMLAKRLAMVGKIDQRTVSPGLCSEQADGFGNKMIAIQDGIVVAVADLFFAAIAKFGAVAGGCVLAEVLGITQVVTRAMIAERMQDNNEISFGGIDVPLEVKLAGKQPAIGLLGAVGV